MDLLNSLIISARGQYNAQSVLFEVSGDKGIKINEGAKRIIHKGRPKAL